MTATLFGYPVELSDDWVDRSVYTFVLKGEEEGEASAEPAQTPAAVGGPVMLQGGAPMGGSAVPSFHANVVAVRDAKGDRDLETYVQEQKQKLAEKMSAAKLVREGATEIGGHPAYEQEYQIPLDRPLPTLVQWHITVDRGDGNLYHFCCSSTQHDFAENKPRFEQFITSWA